MLYVLEFFDCESTEYRIFEGPETDWNNLCQNLMNECLKEVLDSEEKKERLIYWIDFYDLIREKLEKKGFSRVYLKTSRFDYHPSKIDDYGDINKEELGKVFEHNEKVNLIRKEKRKAEKEQKNQ